MQKMLTKTAKFKTNNTDAQYALQLQFNHYYARDVKQQSHARIVIIFGDHLKNTKYLVIHVNIKVKRLNQLISIF